MMEETEVINNLSEEIPQPERPFMRDIPGGIRLTWQYADIEIAADILRITDKAIAEVTFYYSTPGSDRETLLLATNRLDCLSSTQKYNLKRQLEDIGYTKEYTEFADWERKVNQIALAVLQKCRQDNPAIEVRIDDDIPLAAEYVVKPILYKDVPNVIFGDYGSYKSILAMVIAYIAQLPYPDNELGLTPGDKNTNCLWLDYEGQSGSFKQRWAAIQHGFHLDIPEDCPPQMTILYKEMKVPLYDAIEPLQYEMAENNIGLTIIDSLGPAAGGNLNEPEQAIRYHQALRILRGTNLSLAHNSKDLTTGTKSIFGSVFFSNLARSIWQCKAEKEPMSSRGIISLKHVKASLSQLHGTIGFALDFDENSNKITVTKNDLLDTGLARELTLSVRIKNELRTGAMTIKELASALEGNEGSIRTAVNRLADKEVVTKIGEAWGLTQA